MERDGEGGVRQTIVSPTARQRAMLEECVRGARLLSRWQASRVHLRPRVYKRERPSTHCLSVCSHCLSLCFHCLSMCFHCLSLCFHCPSLQFSLPFNVLPLPFLVLPLPFNVLPLPLLVLPLPFLVLPLPVLVLPLPFLAVSTAFQCLKTAHHSQQVWWTAVRNNRLAVRPARQRVLLAVGKTVVLRPVSPPLPQAGVSIVMDRGCQQNDSLADG